MCVTRNSYERKSGIMELKQYSKFEKDFSKASLISAPESELLEFNIPKDPNFADASYI